MIACFAVDNIVTPKKIRLRGLWLGKKRAKTVCIFIHGLGGSHWSQFSLMRALSRRDTAVLTFSNRGHDKIAFVARAGKNSHTRLFGGAAHERFTDCVDDIQGAVNFARRQGARDICLIGHSTGCQKSVYWASENGGGRGVRGIVLLAPVSDYAAALAADRRGKLARLTATARRLVRAGKRHQLMSSSILDDRSLHDAQRFLSLNTPDSAETMFSYEQPRKQPRRLQRVKKPILVLWAEKDEYADRPAKEIAAWFEKSLKNKHTIVIIPGVKHGFKGAERTVALRIKKFMKDLP